MKTVSVGFGDRLREERKRLGLSQDACASAAGINRLAQSQYERENTSPTVRYLFEVSKLGVDLNYLLFGQKHQIKGVSNSDRKRLEQRIFQIIEDYADRSCEGKLSAESRYILFDVLRNEVFSREGVNSSNIDTQNLNEFLEKKISGD